MYARRLDTLDRAEERALEAGGHAQRVDILRRRVFDHPGECDLLHLGGDALPIGRRHLLGVVEAGDARRTRQHDRSHGKRAGHRSAPHFIETNAAVDAAPAHDRLVERIQPFKAFALDPLGLKAAPRHFDG